jgi:cytochrome c
MTKKKLKELTEEELLSLEERIEGDVSEQYPNGHNDCRNMKLLKDYTSLLTEAIEVAEEIQRRDLYKVL